MTRYIVLKTSRGGDALESAKYQIRDLAVMHGQIRLRLDRLKAMSRVLRLVRALHGRRRGKGSSGGMRLPGELSLLAHEVANSRQSALADWRWVRRGLRGFGRELGRILGENAELCHG